MIIICIWKYAERVEFAFLRWSIGTRQEVCRAGLETCPYKCDPMAGKDTCPTGSPPASFALLDRYGLLIMLLT